MSAEIISSNFEMLGGTELIDTSHMYESLRFNDYSVENGLGEIVDNAVEAGASEIRVDLKRKTQKYGKKQIEEVEQIAVADNGCGMGKNILSNCLTLGCSMRDRKNGKLGIGKFGVGMTLGGISLARKIEVYSRDDVNGSFFYTYIDLDEIKGGKKKISSPIEKNIPAEYEEFYDGSTGTLVLLTNCDRMDGTGKRTDANEFNGIISNYLGRTYRKFIAGGVKMFLDGRIVYLHDPLYMAGPTQFDTKESQDPKAQPYSETSFDWEIPGGNGEKATIRIKLSLLPLEWRTNIGDGGNIEARKRKIDQNEGVSILRANREVLYDKIPYLIGMKRGQFSYQDNDRWWGCEISFPPELDECFQVRYIKRGAEPIGALKDRLKIELTGAITSLRKRIKEDRATEKAKQKQAENNFSNAEDIMSELDDIFPMNQSKQNMTEEEENAKIEQILDESESAGGENAASREARRESLMNKLYSIVTVSYPASVLFETEALLGDKMVIKLNINHPYYQKVIDPLCGEALKADSAEESVEKAKVRDAIMLLLLSYVKAKSVLKDTDTNRLLFDQLENQWGSILSAVSSKIDSAEM
ncbi:MAG: ATP-binding protein [Lachnospiraceae bacterium]|nr:ATP-binding protein [Lachnospiraceae bacterium]